MEFHENLRVQYGKKTAASIMVSAKKLFGERGYDKTPMEEVVRLSGVTRGALYHHFAGKKGLFLAVFEDALDEITARIYKAQQESFNAWENLLASTHAFFRASIDPELQQIVLIDALSILGWSVWRRTDETRSMVLLKTTLSRLIDDKVIKPLQLEPLSHALWGATSELALMIAHSNNSEKAFKEGYMTMVEIYKSLRIESVD
jgi:AcrR family transcriptional regulator